MSDVDVLNRTLVLENLGIAAYEAALGSALLDEPTMVAARAFQSDHKTHRDLIRNEIEERGGIPVPALDADSYARSFPPLTTQQAIVAYAIDLEAGAARAYVASVAEYDDRSLALLGAEIGGVEAQHWAVLLAATGANPVPAALIGPMGVKSASPS
jgi:Ferritin-like domain